MNPAEKFFARINGPLAIVAGCKLCKHVDKVTKPRAGERGRGWGFIEGNKQRGRMIQHIKDTHPEALQPALNTILSTQPTQGGDNGEAVDVAEAIDQAQAIIDYFDHYEFKDDQLIFNEYAEGRVIRLRLKHLRALTSLYAAPQPALSAVAYAAPEPDFIDAVGWLLDAIKSEVSHLDDKPLLKCRFAVVEKALLASVMSSTQSATTDRNLVESLCDDCPPVGYSTDETRCTPCPRRTTEIPSTQSDGSK